MQEAEEWRRIAGYPNYEVSSLGRVRSLPHHIVCKDGRRKLMAGRVLQASPPTNKWQYPQVNLGRGHHFKVHVLVCTAFKGEQPTPAHRVAHWDGDYNNCREANLRWATQRENYEDALRHGRTTRPNQTLLTRELVLEIRRLGREGIPSKDIASATGITQRNVNNIRSGVSWAGITE